MTILWKRLVLWARSILRKRRLPHGLNDEELALWRRLHDDWDPERRIGMSHIKTSPLSKAARAAITKLGKEYGMSVEFPVLPDPIDPDARPPSYTVYARRIGR